MTIKVRRWKSRRQLGRELNDALAILLRIREVVGKWDKNTFSENNPNLAINVGNLLEIFMISCFILDSHGIKDQ